MYYLRHWIAAVSTFFLDEPDRLDDDDDEDDISTRREDLHTS